MISEAENLKTDNSQESSSPTKAYLLGEVHMQKSFALNGNLLLIP